jgi:hypothetical protein
VNGPISVRIEADSIDAAAARFRTGEFLAAADDVRTDAEDDLDIVGASMTPTQFDDALRAAGCTMVRRLDEAAEANSDGWYLWQAP